MNPPLCTKETRILYQKTLRLIRNPPPKCAKTPRVYQKAPLLTMPEWTPTNPLCTNRNTFCKKKTAVFGEKTF